MHLEDLLAALDVGCVDDDLAVEAARAQKRRVEHVGTVGRSNQHNRLVRLEPVHLDQQLVQGLLALVVTAAKAGASLAPNRVNLINKDDGRRSFFGVLKQVTHAARAHADEHLNEVRARNREERHAGLARNRARKQRFTGTRRANQQTPARNLRANRLVLLRVGEEVLDLLHFLDCLVNTRNVRKLDVGALLQGLLRAILAKAQLRVIGLLHLIKEEEEKRGDEDEGQQADQQRGPAVRQRNLVGDVGVVGQKILERVGAHIDAVIVAQLAEALRLEALGGDDGKPLACRRAHLHDLGVEGIEGNVEGSCQFAAGRGRGVVRAVHGVVACGIGHALDAALLDSFGEGAGIEGVGLRLGVNAEKLAANEKDDKGEQDDHDDRRARFFAVVLLVRAPRVGARSFGLPARLRRVAVAPFWLVRTGVIGHKAVPYWSCASCLEFASNYKGKCPQAAVVLTDCPEMHRLAIDFWLENADISEVAVAFGVVEAVSNEELIRAGKAQVCAVDVGLVGDVFAQKRRNFHRKRAAGGQVLADVLEGQA